MVTVEINVTKKDIGNGVCSAPGNCPVALAAIRTGFDQVAVLGDCMDFQSDENYYAIGLPLVAKKFIYAFDEQQPVKPFKFRIKLKNSVAKQLKLRKSAIVSA